MKVSQLLYVMERDADVVIDDAEKPIDRNCIYQGAVRGIRKESPINRMHVVAIHSFDEVLWVLVETPKARKSNEPS